MFGATRHVAAAARGSAARVSRSAGGLRSAGSLPRRIAPQLCEYMDGLGNRKEPVVLLASPAEVRAAFREAGIPIELGGSVAEKAQGTVSLDGLSKAVDLVLKYSVRTGHPLFFNQLYARAQESAIAADWVAAATNTNCHTFEVAPVYTIIEAEVLSKIAKVLGGAFADAHDGLFVPGGSLSNLYGMHLARHRADPDLHRRGAVGGPRFVAYTSDQSHYSYLKSSRLTCLGSDNLVAVETDARGRMDAEKLEEAILKTKAEGGQPFFVGSTAGTTVLGAYDPFDKIAGICQKHGLWHHIDACWGGGALLSEKHRHNLHSAELADSLAWNPHKMSGATLQCSAFITRHAGILAQTNGTNAAYLFQPDKLNTELDVGDKTIQCGRKADMLKLWMMWKAKGDLGMQHTVDRSFALADLMVRTMRGDSNGAWQLVYEPSCTNVCFWYVPKQLRPFNFETATEAQLKAINQVAPLIKNEMQRTGDALIGFQAVNGRPNFFRMVFASTDTVEETDVLELIERMAALGEKLCGHLTA